MTGQGTVRQRLRAVTGGAAVVVVSLGGLGTAASAEPMAGRPAPVLTYGTPRQADLLAEHLDAMVAGARTGLQPQLATGRPLYPSAVVLAARHAVVARHEAMGYAVRYSDDRPTELPPEQWVAAHTDTIYDLASVSKLFTSIAAVQQVERGLLSLDATVASYLPAFAVNGKDGVTVRMLLTHTSGLPAWLPLWSAYDDYDARIAAVYAAKPVTAPGTGYLYSDLNMITLGKLVEHVTGRSLDAVVHDGITAPLGMVDTGYNPPATKRPRIAATEYQGFADRGMVWGGVHDENAWSLGGVAGHAGVFSTARDLAVLCQTILNGGTYGRARVLSRQSTATLLTNENSAFPGNDHGLGFELNQRWYMGAMATPRTAGHTGYTGTMLVIDPTTDSFAVLLTNRVHPSRAWGSINPARRAVTDALARAVPVRPVRGRTAWFGGMQDATTATLTAPVTLPPGAARATFALWYDTEPGTDVLALEMSIDDGATWSPVPFDWFHGGLPGAADGTVSGYSGRRWLGAYAELPDAGGPVQLRWRYTTDPLYHGRGVYVDAIRVTSGHQLLFDDSRPADAARVAADGWTPSTG